MLRIVNVDELKTQLRSSNSSDVFVPGTKTKMGDRAA